VTTEITEQNSGWVLYDGECAFCRAGVARSYRLLRRRGFKFAALQASWVAERFGLHSGQMFLGSIGGSHHYEYQAVGDMVNTATRIQGLSKYLGTRILASEATIDGLEESGLWTIP